ncbi:MAG: T9SS type A sorting domain-containing protein [Calditrichaeota bacterium]|nr:T9SS type A sorting domain-containing protein [Calditrichota bacterium]
MKNLIMILLFASLLKAGDEFLVNTTIENTQRDSQIEWIDENTYAVVWNSVSENDPGDIFLQFFSNEDIKTGDEIKVNQHTAGEQEKISLASNGKGSFIVAWASHNGVDSVYDVKTRIFSEGAFGDEILVNTTIDFSQTNPVVAMDSQGNAIAAWESWYQDGSDRGIYAQRFNAAGEKVGGEFRANTRTEYSQARPAVKFFDDGRFIIIWESWKQDIQTPAGYGIVGQLFTADAEKIGGEFGINTQTNDYQWFGDIETFAGGSFFVTWCSWQQDGDRGGIFLQKFDKNGNKQGPETQVNETTYHYQWLPRIKKMNDKIFSIVWSSWMQDDSREGVVAQMFDTTGYKRSFETPVNLYHDSFQWEPDFIPTQNDDELLVCWSSWGQYNNDYEVIARRIQPVMPIGVFDEKTYSHEQGRSTFTFKVHVVDSSQLQNKNYEMSFSDITEDAAKVSIKNTNSEEMVVSDYPLDRGVNAFYITPVFDGIAVQFNPVFEMTYDADKSYFLNSTGTNVLVDYTKPTIGTTKIAPIDVALIWGSTDTLNGQYTQPLDTANGFYGAVPVPFKAWNLTDNEPIDLFVAEDNKKTNNFWEPTERIIFLTPEAYRDNSNNTHVEITTALSAGTVTMPAAGDTQFVYTKRPITVDDLFKFATSKTFVSGIMENVLNAPDVFALKTNYPNPFNPTTTIPYSLPATGKVTLEVFNILGQKVTTLVNTVQQAGQHRVLFNGKDLASGSYFIAIRFKDQVKVGRMLLIK